MSDEILSGTGAVMVPSSVIELNKTNTAFHQTSRQQTIVGKGSLARLSAIHLVNVFRLFGNLHQFGNARLHTIGHFIGSNARRYFRICKLNGAHLIEISQGIQRLPSGLNTDSVRVGQE